MRNVNDLQKEEMEELIKDYKSPSSVITVAKIIEKYDLNIKAAKIASSLPEQIVEDRCLYCDIPMVAKIRNRTEMTDPYCQKCGHIAYKENRLYWKYKVCECNNCQRTREEDKLRKRKLISIYYSEKHRQFELNELSLNEKVFLYRMINESTSEGAGFYFGNKCEEYVAEISKLYEKGVISVSPTSPIDAFAEDSFPRKFYPAKVFFDVNMKLANMDDIDSLFMDEFSKSSPKEKYDLFIEIMHKDVLNRFESMMKERGLEFEVLSNAEDALKNLYSKVSYAQIISLCFRVARYYLDKTKTRKIYKKAAAKGALKCVVTFYENSVKNGWQINNSEVNYAGQELKYYVTEIMKEDIRILRDVITIKHFE